MPSALVEAEVDIGRGGRGPIDDRGGGGGDGGGGGAPQGPLPFDTARLGLWAFLASVTMLFAAFTSAFIVRRAAGGWVAIDVPPLLWINTVVLLSSSIVMALSRRSLRYGRLPAFRRYFGAAFLLGSLFLAGQVLAWRELGRQGVFLSTNPHSSFFYVLTGVHAAHVLGGVAALGYVGLRALRGAYTSREAVGPRLAATYWHFVDGLWVYVFLVLFVV
jgi:cytochrome c oxidase subunit 3